jgi:hypothetical protein
MFLTGYLFKAAMRFNAGRTMMVVDIAAGGGLVETFNICLNGNCGGEHQGCASNPAV